MPKLFTEMSDGYSRNRHGQLIRESVARDGAAKRLDPAPAGPGMKRVTAPSHEFLHGAPVNDEPLQKNWQGKQVPVAFGHQSRDKRGVNGDGFGQLRSAGDYRDLSNPMKR